MIQFLIAAKIIFADWFLISILLTNILRKAMQNLVNNRYTYKKEKNLKKYQAG